MRERGEEESIHRIFIFHTIIFPLFMNPIILGIELAPHMICEHQLNYNSIQVYKCIFFLKSAYNSLK